MALHIIVQPGWALPQKREKKKTGEKKRERDKEIWVDPGEQREND